MVSKPIFRQQNYIQVLLLISTWLLGNINTYRWFIESLADSNYLNIALLAIGCIVLLVRLIHTGFFKSVSFEFRFNTFPLLLMLGGEIGAIALKWSINIPQLNLFCFILGSYGLLGLLINYDAWHKGLCYAIIAACILPFLVAFNSGLGFPVRVITAHTVAQALSDFHLSAVSSHDIIVMENGIAQVDLPCSGMKSLWTGTLFLLGATWLEKRQLGFRWLLVAIANLGFLIAANIIRVLILVITIEVLQRQQVADILHLPLGVAGFIIASIFTWILLQKVPQHSQTIPVINSAETNQKKFNLNWLLLLVIVLGIVGQIKPFNPDVVSLKSINLPSEIATKSLALTTAEANFFDNPANPLVQKLHFQTNNLSGSMLLVASNTWQAHHPPELCFMGNGFKVDSMESKLINNNINARWLSLQNGKLSATYWFQSSQTTTDDFVSRIWDHISHHDQTWVLVSVLFDHAESYNSTEIKEFSHTIYRTINQDLNG